MKIDDKGMPKVLYQDVMYQAHYSVDYIDLHEFWSNSSDIPATPLFLANDLDDILLDSTIGGQLIDSSGSIPPSVECLLFPDPPRIFKQPSTGRAQIFFPLRLNVKT
jgi:hypothetical protein